MRENSLFNIHIDFQKSRASYLYDKMTQKQFLDFFGLYSSLPLGYNHEIFSSDEFKNAFLEVSTVKIPNSQLITDPGEAFFNAFTTHPKMQQFSHFHFTCTGALAIESALKVAIIQKPSSSICVLSMRESFHGMNSWGNFLTDRILNSKMRLDGMPEMPWIKLPNPKITYTSDGAPDIAAALKKVDEFEEAFRNAVKEKGAANIPALIIEPIQSTHGDNHYPKEFFARARALCTEFNICLIFDEVQTGFSTTGTMWYFEQLGIVPDIVVFGKKTQVSGIMATDAYEAAFKNIVRLQVTWDGSLEDMIRCTYILKAYEKYSILQNVAARNEQLMAGLKSLKKIQNVRSAGMLLAFDFENATKRDEFFKAALGAQFMCNRTGERSIRLRPNLAVSSEEVKDSLHRIATALQEN